MVSPPIHAGAEPDSGAKLRTLVTGATGTLGRRLTGELARRGHEVIAATRQSDLAGPVGPIRYMTVDLGTGEGLEAALSGVGAVIHSASDFHNPTATDLDGLRALDAAADPEVHLLFPGIVGCDLIPAPYYKVKTACEDFLRGSARPWSILRATQFHQLIWGWYSRPSRNPFLFVPADTRYQVLDPLEMARHLADAVEIGPQGRMDDLGGPFAYDAEDLAGSVQTATGGTRRIVAYNRPGVVGAALRAGANLTPNRGGGETWNDFVARQMARSRN